MNINSLIGVSGSINSGKDLVGDMLMYIGEGLTRNPTFEGFEENERNKNHKYSVKTNSTYAIKKCADKLKEVVALAIGCTREDLEDEEFKNKELGEEWWRYEMVTVDGLVIIDKAEYDGIPKDWQEGFRLVKLTPRMVLQLFGTQGGRMVVHPNIWVNSLFADYKPHYIGACDPYELESEVQIYTNYPKWIITDVRFPKNEGVAVTKRGGLLIGIKRKFALKQPKYAYLIDGGRDEYEIPYELEELDNKLYKSLTHESELSMGNYSWCDSIIENNGTIEELFNQVLKIVTNKT
jgi:hypothetical protein